jgi:hypothetical protein
MKRPIKSEFDFNDHFECVSFSAQMIKYADHLEGLLGIRQAVETTCDHNYRMIGHQFNGHYQCTKCNYQKN